MRWLCCLALALLPLGLTANDIMFVDENVKALCVGKWDTDGNGELSEEEAAAVTTLGRTFAFKPQILSFDELKYFTGLTYLDQYEFMNCSGLQCVTIPSGVTTLKEKAFYGCSSMTSVTIPYSVTSLGSSPFGECSGLTSVTIPDSVTTIRANAFCLCKSLTSVTIPSSVTTIGVGAFGRCESLRTIVCSGNYDTLRSVFARNNSNDENIFACIDACIEQEKQYLLKYRRKQGLCSYCGGAFKHGLFSTKCINCGRKKDY